MKGFLHYDLMSSLMPSATRGTHAFRPSQEGYWGGNVLGVGEVPPDGGVSVGRASEMHVDGMLTSGFEVMGPPSLSPFRVSGPPSSLPFWEGPPSSSPLQNSGSHSLSPLLNSTLSTSDSLSSQSLKRKYL